MLGSGSPHFEDTVAAGGTLHLNDPHNKQRLYYLLMLSL